jgi:hypothetical protein
MRLILLTLSVLALLATSAGAQCPTGWTSTSTTVIIPGTPACTTTVYYCYRNNYMDGGTFVHCGIHIEKICPACPGMTHDAIFEAIISQWANSANPLGLGFGADCASGSYRWVFQKPYCTDVADGCVVSCDVNNVCKKSYDACWDYTMNVPVGALKVTYVSSARSSTSACTSPCQTGSCP